MESVQELGCSHMIELISICSDDSSPTMIFLDQFEVNFATHILFIILSAYMRLSHKCPFSHGPVLLACVQGVIIQATYWEPRDPSRKWTEFLHNS
ncbi:hypothetical protein Y032_0007g3393 [Ancylostoma ceylanicum]|uniref:Uncharacterized protein n=1 Tax=Ancylostoma ceylanicum TaxID=53326 RepID=A0A016VNX4_9BILA|nr:hypothetical protein Y032_0007g3393 [Ancylostoma ceylanicum]